MELKLSVLQWTQSLMHLSTKLMMLTCSYTNDAYRVVFEQSDHDASMYAQCHEHYDIGIASSSASEEYTASTRC